VSPAILAEILAGRLKPGLRGDLAELCVLFSDVRGYTTLSEGRRPEAVIELLNRYFDRMAPAIHAHGGTVDKFLGDGIMAHFGHPASLQEPCRAAFEAARLMLQELDDLNRELTTEGLPALRIGIGLHAGEAVVGYIGSRERHEYTAIGDTVNVASRIEGLTKEAGYPLLMTAPVAERLGADTGLVPLGERALKGHTPLAVFGWRPAALAPSLKTGDNTP
jgi:adenylate cyclase